MPGRNILLLLFFAIIVSCCSDSDLETVSIGKNFIKPQTHVVMIDSFAVNLSTIKLDSLQTSASGVLLAGTYEDPYLGKISSTGFFQITLPDITELPKGSVFDSLTLILDYNGKWYGDTLQPFTLNVYRVTEEIETNNAGYLCNIAEFSYNPEPIGTATVKPKPNFHQNIEIRLSDELGKELTGMFLEDSDIVSSEADFLDYFKGLAVGPAPTDVAALLGFEASDSVLNMVLYTHYSDQERKETIQRFLMYAEETCFNHIDADRSGTTLENLNLQKNELSSDETNQMAFLQGGTGIATRIDFPGISRLLELGSGSILYKAEIILKPYPKSFSASTLPTSLIFYTADGLNKLTSLMEDDDGYAVTADYQIDKLYDQDTWFKLDVTDFIMTELQDSYFDPDVGLVVTLDETAFGSTFDRITFDARTNLEFRPKLQLYFLFYE